MQKCQESIREAKEARAAEVLGSARFTADLTLQFLIASPRINQPSTRPPRRPEMRHCRLFRFWVLLLA